MTAYDYVQALAEEGLADQLLLLAFPFIPLQEGSPFHKFAHLFSGGLAERYLNVVMGVNPILETFVLSNLQENQRKSLKKQKKPVDEVELAKLDMGSPEPDLVRLYTVGIVNVALVSQWPRQLRADEVKALGHYDVVAVPTVDDANALTQRGLITTVASPIGFAQLLRGML